MPWIALAFAAAPAPGAAEALDLPDLTPLEPVLVQVGPADGDPEVAALRFGVMVKNAGAHALEILSVPDGGVWEAGAHQCVRWVHRACLGHRTAGTVFWHEPHRHWHFDDFALYELRPLGADGVPAPTVAAGAKASFCLNDTIYDGSSSADPTAKVPTYKDCSGVRQGIDPGWIDVYERDLPDQQIRLDGIPDGDYALVIRIDPSDRLVESDETNNTSWLPVRLSGSGTQVAVIGN